MSEILLNKFVDVYQQLNKSNLESLRNVYSQDVEFEDSLHQLKGIDPLIAYFQDQYTNLDHCQFIVKEAHQQHQNAWIVWDMRFSHSKLRGGQEIVVQGASHLRLSDTVSYHRDYVDMGQVLYEHLPILGAAIRWIKKRAVS